MNKINSVVFVSFLILQACVRPSVERQLDDKVNREPAMANRSELSNEAARLINESPSLTVDQKYRLNRLRQDTQAKNNELASRSLKLRAILVKDLMSDDYDNEEVRLIKSKVKNIEDERISTLFGAIDDANKILGREAANRQRILEGFTDMRGGPSDRD